MIPGILRQLERKLKMVEYEKLYIVMCNLLQCDLQKV